MENNLVKLLQKEFQIIVIKRATFSFRVLFVLLITTVFQLKTFGQKVTWSGYMDFYYNYDFSKPASEERPDFIYSYKKHNQPNINLTFAKVAVEKDRFRGNVALMYGNYASYNLASEPIWARFILEANVGVRLMKKGELWLDGGVFSSHIGFETAIASECQTMSRSMAAENSPYYETGLRLSYQSKNEKVKLAFLLLNGWQRIMPISKTKLPAFGLQCSYNISKNVLINYSNFIGIVQVQYKDSWRVFHNFYALCTLSKKIDMTIGFDIGADKISNTQYGAWFSPVVITRFKVAKKWNLATRLEYYHDVHQMMVTVNGHAFKNLGFSINADYQILPNLLWRNEFKMYSASEPIYERTGKQNYCLGSSLIMNFSVEKQRQK